ncbi:MAG: hypothetical protein AAB421_04835 [Patescibacteria group bacterium]
MTELIQFSLTTVLGLFVAASYGKKTKGFRISEYVALFFAPLLLTVWFSYTLGPKILVVGAVSGIGGTMMEWLVGWAYHQALGTRLWEYKRLAIQGYTSWLSIPLWAIVGVMAYLFSRAMGL